MRYSPATDDVDCGKMTTLRRVLLQSAKEADPAVGPVAPATSVVTKPITPHASKNTPRRPSSHLSGSEHESGDDESRDNEKRGHLSKKRRTSRGWDDANKESALENSKSPKGAREEPHHRSPRMMSRNSSASSMSVIGKSPKTILPPPPTMQDKSFSLSDKVTLVASTKVADKSSEKLAEKSTVEEPANEKRMDINVDKDAAITVQPKVKEKDERKERRSRSASPPPSQPSPPPLTAKNMMKQISVVSTSSASSASGDDKAAKITRQVSVGGSVTVTHAVIAQEWVQCEECKKWRKLPLNITADSLPEFWTCNMNNWNTSLASCMAAVEEGSEETTDDHGASGKSGTHQLGANQTNGVKRAVLPPGINLYGGNQAATDGALPGGVKQPKSTYRSLIAAHYRANKGSVSTSSIVSDMRYGAFPCYTSHSLKPRPFDQNDGLVAFPRFGWCKGNISKVGQQAVEEPSGKAVSGNIVKDPEETMMPPKMLFRMMFAAGKFQEAVAQDVE